MLVNVLTVGYIFCFQACAWPAIVRIVRRGSSGDCSVWREWLVIIGVCAQFAVMLLTGADWRVAMSPVLSGLNVSILLALIYRYRHAHAA